MQRGSFGNGGDAAGGSTGLSLCGVIVVVPVISKLAVIFVVLTLKTILIEVAFKCLDRVSRHYLQGTSQTVGEARDKVTFSTPRRVC